jgi:hypothetical protein
MVGQLVHSFTASYDRVSDELYEVLYDLHNRNHEVTLSSGSTIETLTSNIRGLLANYIPLQRKSKVIHFQTSFDHFALVINNLSDNLEVQITIDPENSNINVYIYQK